MESELLMTEQITTTALFFHIKANNNISVELSSSDELQPHIVEISASLIDMDKKECIQTIDLIVSPETWDINEEFSEYHNITNDFAERVGVSEKSTVEILWQMFLSSNFRVCFNEDIDALVLIAFSRYLGRFEVDKWQTRKAKFMRDAAMLSLRSRNTGNLLSFSRKTSLDYLYRILTGNHDDKIDDSSDAVCALLEIYAATNHEKSKVN